jgi:TonB family protein
MQNSAPSYFGRYQVLEELGSGAMGVVYLCVDPRLARPVAVKVLKESEFMSPQEREQFHARFRHEAEAAGRLNHPGIVQIFDIGPSYIVMEYLEGQPLSASLRSGTALKVKQIVTLLQSVADAVDYAHRHGIVHRDIKPANIMMLDAGGMKVCDFGVARLESSNLTAVGTVVGSVRYMAPEQMMGEKVDGRADVFSLAAVGYELLTARAPFPGKSITEVVARVVHGSHIPPREVDARLPEALNVVFAKAFAPRPERRYNQALDFSRDVASVLLPFQELEIAHRGEAHSPTRIESQATTVKGPAPVPPGTTVRGAAGLAPPPPPPTPEEAATSVFTAAPVAPGPAGLHREGVLILDSDPAGAQVFVDSKPVGRAPLEWVDVAFGRHLVRMELAGRESVSTTIEVRPERPLKVVTFTLPLPGPGSGMVRPGQLVTFGPDVQPPARIAGSVPGYPKAARERGLEGTPVVEVWVSETGEVFNTAILESAGDVLDKALLTAVTRWRFAPATLRGVPVSVRISVQHHFRR